MKYLIIKRESLPEIPVIFPTLLEHFALAKAMEQIGWEITSAGFVDLTEDKVITSGGSFTLKMKAKEEDNIVIQMALRY